MIEINISPTAPYIAHKIKEVIEDLTNPENYALSLQLDYKDVNSIFYLKNVYAINFQKDWVEIRQWNNSHTFFEYKYILEYCVLNSDDTFDLEGY